MWQYWAGWVSRQLRNVQICQGIFHIIHTDTLCFLTLGNVQLPISVSHKKYEEEKYSKTSINIFTWTTLTTNTRETGRERRMIKSESPVMRRAHSPGPSSQPEHHGCTVRRGVVSAELCNPTYSHCVYLGELCLYPVWMCFGRNAVDIGV